MERRLLLAIVLTFVVLTAYQWLVPMSQPVPVPATHTATPGAAAPAPQPPAAPATPPAAPITPPGAPQAIETLQADTAERTITVDNGVVRAVFSNRGATLAAWELSNYTDAGGRPV